MLSAFDACDSYKVHLVAVVGKQQYVGACIYALNIDFMEGGYVLL